VPELRRTREILVLLAVGAVVAAGCAGDGGDGEASGAQATPAATAAPASTATGDTTTAGGGGRDAYGGGRGGYGDPSDSTGGTASGGGSGNVRIADFAFAPATVRARVGQKVTWEQEDARVTHTVTALDGSFRSGGLAEGRRFSHVFRRAGTFSYRCDIHPSMRGTVKVSG
jgi:plastocyanin